MSQPEDEADRIARKLVRVESPNAINNDVYIGSAKVAGYNYVREQAEVLASSIRTAIVASIREALEGRDRILTDLLHEDERAHEMWRLGAEEMREELAIELEKMGYAGMLDRFRGMLTPTSVANDSHGKPLHPSVMCQKVAKMDAAIRKALSIMNQPIASRDDVLPILKEALKS